MAGTSRSPTARATGGPGGAVARAGRPPAEEPQRAAAGVDEPHHRRAPALGHDAARGVLRGHVRVRQLRRGAGDGQRRGAAQYARDLSERIIPRGVETHEVVGIVLLLRDVLARSLFEKYQDDFDLLNRVLDAYEPAANRIANTVAVSFVEERERVIREQADALPRAVDAGAAGARTAAHPPDHRRAGQRTGPPAHRAAAAGDPQASGARGGHRHHGVADVDEPVANHLVQTVDASRLMGAEASSSQGCPRRSHRRW